MQGCSLVCSVDYAEETPIAEIDAFEFQLLQLAVVWIVQNSLANVLACFEGELIVFREIQFSYVCVRLSQYFCDVEAS